GVLDGDALNRQGHDLLRLALGVLARLLPDVPHRRRRLAAGLVLDAAHQLFFRFLSAQPGDLLEPLARFLLLPGERPLAVAEPLVTTPQLAVAFLVPGDVLLERCFPLVEVRAPAGELAFQRLARLEELFFGDEGEALAGFLEEPLAFLRRRRRGPAQEPATHDGEGRSRGKRAGEN